MFVCDMITQTHQKGVNRRMISLYGFYQYDNTIFEGMILPDGLSSEILRDLIIEKSGMLYPFHQQPAFLKLNIAHWFSRKYSNISRMVRALNSEYNPIENYDRKEDWTDTPDVTYTKSGGHSNHIDSKSSSDIGNKVSAFNSDTLVSDTSGNSGQKGESTETFTYADEAQKETGTRTHTGRLHGNIGVTTNQQMIQSELDLRIYDIYETLATMFEKDFLIRVY